MTREELEKQWELGWAIANEVAAAIGVDLKYSPFTFDPLDPGCQEQADAHWAVYRSNLNRFVSAFRDHLEGLETLPIPFHAKKFSGNPPPRPVLPMTREPETLVAYQQANHEWMETYYRPIEVRKLVQSLLVEADVERREQDAIQAESSSGR